VAKVLSDEPIAYRAFDMSLSLKFVADLQTEINPSGLILPEFLKIFSSLKLKHVYL